MTDKELRDLAQLEKEGMEVPETVHRAVEETLQSLPEQKAEVVSVHEAKTRRWKLPATIAAAFLALLIVLPNTSYTVARAMGSLPVIGTVFEAVTFREYDRTGENLDIEVRTPAVNADRSDNTAAPAVSREIDELNEAAVARFQKEHGDGSVGSLNIDYDVVANTDRWYTVRVTQTEAGADTMETSYYYTFDKQSGETVILSDLFEKDAYIDHISENIKEQMRRERKADETKDYFLDSDLPEEDFREIDPNQDFYMDEKGRLVICFDEMEVAPAYMGSVSFTIPKSVYEGDLHPEYQ